MRYAFGFEGGLAGIVLSLAAAGLVAWTWRRKEGAPRAALWLRTAALAALALCSLKVTLKRLDARLAKPPLAIILDNGSSMSAKDGGQVDRLQRAIQWLKANRGSIEDRAQVSLFSASDRAKRISWDDLERLKISNAGFDIESALTDTGGVGLGRTWLFSDGISDSESREPPAPVDTVGVGPAKTVKSLLISELLTPDFVFLHSRFNISANFEASGLGGSFLSARLIKNGAVVSQQRLSPTGDFEAFQSTFSALAESLGQERYRLEVVDERTGAKLGSREARIEVIRQKHRVMYLAGRPSPEYSALREHLKSDPNHELVSFVILRNPENVSPVPDHELSLIPFPAQEIFVQNLFQFDLFILENFAYWRFNLPVAYLDGLKRFVAQGGALLVIGGSNAYTQGGYRATPLEEILPVNLWTSSDDFLPGLFKPVVLQPEHPLILQSDSLESSKAAWESLPPMDGFNRFNGVKPGATVLLSVTDQKTPGGMPMPLLAIRDYGKGKVMVLGTDSTWRWKLAAGANWRISSFYGRFWNKAVQYLSGTLDLKKVKFSPLPDRMPAQEPALLTLNVFDESFRPLQKRGVDVKTIWTTPDGKQQNVTANEKEPGRYEIALTGLAPGAHIVRGIVRQAGQILGEDTARFLWEAAPPELPLRRQWLKALSERSGGRYSDLSRVDAKDWLAELPAVKKERQVLQRWHVWNSGFWLLLIAACLAGEWLIRRRAGFV